eukprot:506828-Amphidinium_carterae.1
MVVTRCEWWSSLQQWAGKSGVGGVCRQWTVVMAAVRLSELRVSFMGLISVQQAPKTQWSCEGVPLRVCTLPESWVDSSSQVVEALLPGVKLGLANGA